MKYLYLTKKDSTGLFFFGVSSKDERVFFGVHFFVKRKYWEWGYRRFQYDCVNYYSFGIGPLVTVVWSLDR